LPGTSGEQILHLRGCVGRPASCGRYHSCKSSFDHHKSSAPEQLPSTCPAVDGRWGGAQRYQGEASTRLGARSMPISQPVQLSWESICGVGNYIAPRVAIFRPARTRSARSPRPTGREVGGTWREQASGNLRVLRVLWNVCWSMRLGVDIACGNRLGESIWQKKYFCSLAAWGGTCAQPHSHSRKQREKDRAKYFARGTCLYDALLGRYALQGGAKVQL
jgi:hypothetical protein